MQLTVDFIDRTIVTFEWLFKDVATRFSFG